MPIILAIEPDRRQAAHLAAIVRHQVGAELLLAHTTEGALDAIGNRVPDLVLVPALLSPQDDAALAAALRVIAAAAHVRTLTIPVLANGVNSAAREGMLAKWRKRRVASPEPDGCDPSVFGEQIAEYLREAAAERAQLEEDSLFDEEPPSTVRSDLATVRSDLEVRPSGQTFRSDLEIGPYVPTEPAGQTFRSDLEVRPYAATVSSDPEVVQPLQQWAAPPVEEIAIDADEPLIDLSDELEGLAADEDDELFDGERVGIYTISAEPEEPSTEAFDLLAAILAPAAAPGPEPPAAESAEAAEAAVMAAPFVEPAEPPRGDLEPWEPMYLTPGRLWPMLEGVPAEMPAPRAEQPDWIELIASLRQDLERRGPQPAPSASADAHQVVPPHKTRSKKAKPVQDEWGFFDPEQCGFSTLLAKLDEIVTDA